MEDLIRDFVVETIENLDVVDAELVRFERDPQNPGPISQIFRLVHTIKGTCGFLGLARLERIAHAAEGLINRFQSGDDVSEADVSLVLSALDRIKFIVSSLGETGLEPGGDDADVINRLKHRVEQSGPEHDSAGQHPARGTLVYQILERPLRADEVSLDDLERAFRDAPGPQAEGEQTDPVPEQPSSTAPSTAAIRGKSVRVAVERLDHLMNMVSELVLVRNQLLEMSRRDDASGFKLPLQRLSHITGELQDGVMRTRMQAIGAAWSNMPRIARDLSIELGKQIEIVTTGSDTEIDRQLLEVIKDSIVHIVRNAADHGIEMPAERIASDKPAHGTIRLSAGQQGSHIIVEVSDDGRGIDVTRIRERAFLNGLLDEETRNRLTDAEIARLIFAPGFSTAAQVTNLSGRGVGLDAVRSNIEQVGGSVDVISRPGSGASVILKLPLTLAIAAVLIVEAHGQKYALPQIAIAELVRTNQDSDVRIETINGAPMLRMRSGLLPVVDLAGTLHDEDACLVGTGFIVVCQLEQQRFGLAVDVIHQTEEIVVKPISAKLRHIPYFSGATILGDGSVILILEPGGFASLALENGAFAADDAIDARDVRSSLAEKTSLLIFRAGPGNSRVVPLALIARLEDIEPSAIEHAGEGMVLQYQGSLMPLLPATPDTVLQTTSRQPILVLTHAGQSVGLLVDEIVDVVDEVLDVDLRHQAPGFIGSAIIHGQAMDVLDVAAVFDIESKGRIQMRAEDRGASEVLLSEPSEFFRAMLMPLIRGSGFELAVAESHGAAHGMIEQKSYAALVVDLDDDLQSALLLARQYLEGGNTPLIIGLATRGSFALRQRAQEAGIGMIVGKFDRQALLRAIHGGSSVSEIAA